MIWKFFPEIIYIDKTTKNIPSENSSLDKFPVTTFILADTDKQAFFFQYGDDGVY